jgi:hypothetical protein
MKRHIPTFDQYLAEQADASFAYDPAKSKDVDPTGTPLKSVDDLTPGKEYVITLDGTSHKNMVYSGVTDGYHIFNEADHKEEPTTFTSEAIAKVIAAEGVKEVVA